MRSKPKGSEVSRYDTLKQVEKSTGKTPAGLLDVPELQPEHAQAWELFNKLGQHSYQEIDAYCRLTGNFLSAWEVDAIMTLTKYIGEEITRWPPK